MQQAEVEDTVGLLVEIENLAVLGEDEIGLAMKLVPTDDYNEPTP